MVTAIPVRRTRPRHGPVASLVAAARGLALFGLMLALRPRAAGQRYRGDRLPTQGPGVRQRPEGRSNAAIGQRMVITERAVAKHTASIFLKLDLQPSDDDNRRVLAVPA